MIRKLVTLLAVLCGPLIGGVSPFLTWQGDPHTTMTVQWITHDAHSTENTLFFRAKQKSTQHPLPNHTSTLHRVELTDLTPGTLYEFQLQGKNYQFRTIPNKNTPLRFIVGGDLFHSYPSLCKETNLQAAKHNPLFVVIGGDIAYSTSRKAENGQRWFDWLSQWSETMVTPEGCLIPMIPAIGNHEVCGHYRKTPKQAAFFYALFPFPGLQGYNVIDFGDDFLTILLLDSGHTHPVTGQQTSWLHDTLQQREHFQHKIAVYHVPAYPCVRNPKDKISKLIRRNWSPLFDQFGVHAAFEHHDHAYKRTHAIRNDKKHPEGVLYLGDGGWGTVPRKVKTPKQRPYLAKTLSARHFILVDLEPAQQLFTATAIDGRTGQTLDMVQRKSDQ